MGDGRRPQALGLLAVAVVALLGVVLEVVGAAPWLALASAAGIVVLTIGQRFSWTLAVALATAGMLCAYVVLLRLSYLIPIALEYQLALSVLLISGVGWGMLWRSRGSLRLPPWAAVAPLAPIVLLIAATVVAVAVTQGARVSWAMHGDAVWNLMTARFVLDDHGVSPGYASAAPLTPALLAAAMAPGRGALDPAAWLQHDATRAAELWLVLMLSSSILAGVVAVGALSKLRPLARGAAVLAVALVPLTWFGAGYAVQFGFYNATIALVLLLCSWIAWTAGPSARLASIVALALCVVAMLATWAPLAVIPAALVAVTTLGGGREWWRGLRRGRLAILVLSAAGVAGYVLAFTLPDLLREGGSLSADGGIFALGPRQVALTAFAALAATALGALLLRRRQAFTGVVVVVVSAGLALGYLLLQRRGLSEIWGYYPAKFGWLVCLLLTVVVGASLAALAERAVRRRGTLLALTVAGAVTLGLISVPLPSRDSLVSLWPTLVPALGGPEEVAAQLFAISDPREKNLVSSSPDDGFINGWLLQQQAANPHDTIRGFAYTLDATDPAQLCAVAGVWGRGVVVHSPNAALPAALRAGCPDAGITAVRD